MLECVRGLCDLRRYPFLPVLQPWWLGRFDDFESVPGQRFGGLAVYGGLGDLLELVERGAVEVEEG